MGIDPATNLEILKDDVMEQTTAVFTTEEVVDPDGSNITSLDSLTMSIIDQATRSVILKERNILSDFNTTTSKITTTLTTNDNIIVDHRKRIEKHILRFDFTYDSGQSTGKVAYIARVINLDRVGQSL